jgi:hypothetical protein
MIDVWNPDQRAPALQARGIRFSRVVEGATVVLEWLVIVGGLLVLAATLILFSSVLNAQVSLNDFDIKASGFWRP